MRERIEALMAEIAGLTCKTEQEIEQARVRLLGKKGEITALFDEFRTVAPELKREFGQKLNVLKNTAAAKIEELKEAAAESPASSAAAFDYTMPGDPVALGSRHPVSIAREEIVNIFRKFGYDVAEGPEVEDDWHVFEALNFPPEHPAREMQDTFFINDSDNPVLLRTHTSSVQVRAMEKMPLPIRIVCPGRVFRNEAISARAHCIFHQVEGLYIHPAPVSDPSRHLHPRSHAPRPRDHLNCPNRPCDISQPGSFSSELIRPRPSGLTVIFPLVPALPPLAVYSLHQL